MSKENLTAKRAIEKMIAIYSWGKGEVHKEGLVCYGDDKALTFSALEEYANSSLDSLSKNEASQLLELIVEKVSKQGMPKPEESDPLDNIAIRLISKNATLKKFDATSEIKDNIEYIERLKALKKIPDSQLEECLFGKRPFLSWTVC